MLKRWDGKILLLQGIRENGYLKTAQFYMKKKKERSFNMALKEKFKTESSYVNKNWSLAESRVFKRQENKDLEPYKALLLKLGERYLNHEFNLLGSGWVSLSDGGSPLSSVSPSQQRDSSLLKGKISEGYSHLHWDKDYISSYSWDNRLFFNEIKIGHVKGVDVKRPWELGRCFHFADLVHLYNLTKNEKYFQEIKNQFYDFCSTNPPYFGVQWGNAMEVSIRAINWIYMIDQLSADKQNDELDFLQDVGRALGQHLQYIVEQLEWTTIARSNHYLANLCGLLFISHRLVKNEHLQNLSFWVEKELAHELNYQFLEDGGCYEGSTGYHRLSSEIVFLSALLVKSKKGTFPNNYAQFKKDNPFHLPFFHKDEHLTSLSANKISKIHHFLESQAIEDDNMLQVGDMDSGRILKLTPLWLDESLQKEKQLMTGPVLAYLEPHSQFLESNVFDQTFRLEKMNSRKVIRETNIDWFFKSELANAPNSQMYEWEVSFDLSVGLTFHSFPQFGLYIIKSPHFFLSMRCGGLDAQNGVGGHSHNDQLAITLFMKGEPYVVDPGSYVYTSNLSLRNAYRSVTAHFSPRLQGVEPSSLNLGAFRLRQNYQAECLYFDGKNFLGWHNAYGAKMFRYVEVSGSIIKVLDVFEGSQSLDRLNLVNNYFIMPVKPSVGYGELA